MRNFKNHLSFTQSLFLGSSFIILPILGFGHGAITKEYNHNHIGFVTFHYLLCLYCYYLVKSYLNYVNFELRGKELIIPKNIVIYINSIFLNVIMSITIWYFSNDWGKEIDFDTINTPYLSIFTPMLIPVTAAMVIVIRNHKNQPVI